MSHVIKSVGNIEHEVYPTCNIHVVRNMRMFEYTISNLCWKLVKFSL